MRERRFFQYGGGGDGPTHMPFMHVSMPFLQQLLLPQAVVVATGPANARAVGMIKAVGSKLRQGEMALQRSAMQRRAVVICIA